MLKAMMLFAVGLYAGVYSAQNYNVPKIENPERLLYRINQLVDEVKQNLLERQQKRKNED